MTHAVTLLLILIFLGRWAVMVPLAALAAILVVVAYHMSEWRSFAALLSAPRSDLVVLLLTFILTIFIDLTVAVQVGVVISSLLFMKRMADVTQIEGLTTAEPGEDDPDEITQVRKRRRIVAGHDIPAGVEVYEVHGPFFFGAAGKLADTMREIDKSPRVLILRMRNVPAIDATGIHAINQIAKKTRLILSEVREQPRRALAGARNVNVVVMDTFDDALQSAS